MNACTWTMWRACLAVLALLYPATGWTYTCTADVPDFVVFYNGSPAEAERYLTVRCTRDPSEPNELHFRALAFMGQHVNPFVSPYRAVRLNDSAHKLSYALRRIDAAGTCGNTTNWLAGNSDVIRSSVSYFPSGQTVSAHRHPVCVRVLGPVNALDPIPAVGVYTDQFTVTVEFTGTGAPGPISFQVPVVVYVAGHCKLRTPYPLNIDYLSFSRQEIRRMVHAGVSCSAKIPWTATIDPPVGTLAGVDYTLSIMRNTGTGQGGEQEVDIEMNIPAGQPGTCGGSRCTATRAHTLTIRY